MWTSEVFFLLLFFGLSNGGDDSASGEYEPPQKRLKTSCYFSKPVRQYPLERIPRDNRYKVSTNCKGALHPMIELAESFEPKLYGAPHELASVLGKAEATFLDGYGDTSPWEEDVICQGHLDELSRNWFKDEFDHVKRMRNSGDKVYACGYPEENHLAQGKRTMSYQMSYNFLLSDNTLVPAGTPLCDRHYKSIPKKSIIPRCSPCPSISQFGGSQPISSNSPQASQGCPSEGAPSSQEVEVSDNDDDSCYEGEKAEDPRKEKKSSLNRFLKEVGIKRAWCKMPFGEMTEKYQKAKTRTVIGILQILVGLITNSVDEYDQLMASVIQMMAGKTLQQENEILHSMMTAVAENFNHQVKYVEKVQLLSIFATHIKYRTIVEYIPNLSERMWREAQIKAMSPKKNKPDINRRERYDPVKIALFISFITSPHVMVGMPWGEQKTKDSSGNIVILPNTIRLTGIYETIQMYETWATQLGHVPLSNSTTYKFLARLPALQSSSKTCVDYFQADATMASDNKMTINDFIFQAFITIQGILKDLGSLNLLNAAEVSAYKRFFEELQVYFRTDYKLHVKEQSRIADHCWIHALSDPTDARFSAPSRTPHEHDRKCPMCEKMEFVFRDLGKRIFDWASSPPSAEAEVILLDNDVDFRNSFDKIMDLKAHIVRTVFTSNERDIFIRGLQEGEAFVTLDFAQKWLPSYFRESQKDFFGKPGFSWHISHVYANVSGELVQHVFVHIFTNEIQNGSIVVEIVKHMADDLAKMGINRLHLRSDNAGYYHSAAVMATIGSIAKDAHVDIASWSFSESQSGKSSADRYASYTKTIMRTYLAKGKDIDTVEQMFVALTEGKGLRGMSVHLATVDFTPQPKTAIKGISKLGHFEFNGDTISAWRFRGIGKGMSVKGLKGIESSITFHGHGGRLSKVGLKDEDMNKIKNGEEPTYWFFPTKKVTTPEPDNVDDEAVTGQAPPPPNADPSAQSLFVCNQCSAPFIRYASLLRHIDRGEHKIRPEKVTMYDFVLGLFKRTLEEVQQAVDVGPLTESFKEYEEAPKNPRPKGWALRVTKKGAKYDPVASKMVEELFDEFFDNGKKLRADEAEKRMRARKDITPYQRMTRDQIKNKITTLLAKKKEKQLKQHRNRQRRTVALIADWERELEEEGGSIEDIEVEIDVEHKHFQTDDLLVTSDSIYDWMNTQDDMFEKISEPLFSDIGEFEQ